MKFLLIFMWMLPEILGVTIVILGPQMYRTFRKGVIDRAVKEVDIGERKGTAMAEYYLDLNLALISALVLGFSLVKFAAVQYDADSGDAPVVLVGTMLGAFFYLLFCIWWFGHLYDETTVKDYTLETKDKVFVLGFKWFKWVKRGRVSGASGIKIWWTRFIPALISLASAALSSWAVGLW